jgi:hypothetical protein
VKSRTRITNIQGKLSLSPQRKIFQMFEMGSIAANAQNGILHVSLFLQGKNCKQEKLTYSEYRLTRSPGRLLGKGSVWGEKASGGKGQGTHDGRVRYGGSCFPTLLFHGLVLYCSS